MAKRKSGKNGKTPESSDVEDAVDLASDATEQAESAEEAMRLTTDDLSTLPDDTDPEEVEEIIEAVSDATEEDGSKPSDSAAEEGDPAETVDAESNATDSEAEGETALADSDENAAVEDAAQTDGSDESAAVEDAADTDDAAAVEETERFEASEASAPVVTPPPPAPQKRSAWPMVLAGVFIAGLGFFAGRSDLINDYLPGSLQAKDQTEPLKAEIAQLREIVEGRAGLGDEIAAVDGVVKSLAAEVAGIEFPEPDFTPVTTELGDLGQRIANIEALLEAASDTPDYSAAFAGLQQASQDQQSRIAEMLAEAEQAKADLEKEAADAKAAAEEAAKRTIAQAALSHLQAALDAGESFTGPLAEFADTGLADVPEELASVAEDGVDTLNDLQLGISGAARDALEAARADAGAAGGIAGFLEKQLGVRSLEPQEGDDPDAVLSRVEAQVRAGDLVAALNEAELLPEPALAAMSDWLGGAKTRVSALSALETLEQSLPTN